MPHSYGFSGPVVGPRRRRRHRRRTLAPRRGVYHRLGEAFPAEEDSFEDANCGYHRKKAAPEPESESSKATESEAESEGSDSSSYSYTYSYDSSSGSGTESDAEDDGEPVAGAPGRMSSQAALPSHAQFITSAAPMAAPAQNEFILSRMRKNGLAGGIPADAKAEFLQAACPEDEVVEHKDDCHQYVDEYECYEEEQAERECDDKASLLAELAELKKHAQEIHKKVLAAEKKKCMPEPELCYEEHDVTHYGDDKEALMPIYVDDFDCWIEKGESTEVPEAMKDADYYKCYRDSGKASKCAQLKAKIAKCMKTGAPFKQVLILPNGADATRVHIAGKMHRGSYVLDVTASRFGSQLKCKGRIAKVAPSGRASVRQGAFAKFSEKVQDAERVKQLAMALVTK